MSNELNACNCDRVSDKVRHKSWCNAVAQNALIMDHSPYLTLAQKCLIDNDHFVSAIKYLRMEHPELSLRDAKEMCETYRWSKVSRETAYNRLIEDNKGFPEQLAYINRLYKTT